MESGIPVVLSPLTHADAHSSERRRNQRVRVAVLGRYMLESRQEFPCQTVDMSPGGVAMIAPVKGSIGEAASRGPWPDTSKPASPWP